MLGPDKLDRCSDAKSKISGKQVDRDFMSQNSQTKNDKRLVTSSALHFLKKKIKDWSSSPQNTIKCNEERVTYLSDSFSSPGVIASKNLKCKFPKPSKEIQLSTHLQ